MKKAPFAAVALFVACVLPLSAQAGKIAVGTEPVMFALYDFRANAEYAVTDAFAVKLDLEFSPNFFWASGLQVIGGIASARYYFGEAVSGNLAEEARGLVGGRGLRGIYAGGGFGFYRLHTTVPKDQDTYYGVFLAPSLLLEGGAKFTLEEWKMPRFYLEPYAGVNVLFVGEGEWTDSSGAAWKPDVDAPVYGGLWFGLRFGYLL